MKCKNMLQMAALAVCSLPMTLSLGSCTEEDMFENYGSVLVDSTYFTYDLSNMLDIMGGTDILHIYTYESTKGKSNNLKHPRIEKQDNRIYVENPKGISSAADQERSTFKDDTTDWTAYNLNGDKVTWTPSGDPYTESHFSFGSGVFRTVAMVQRTDPRNYTIDENSVFEKLKYPSYDNMKDTWFNYNTGAFDGEYYSELQVPWWGWKDWNEYTNANGEEASYVRQANGYAIAGISQDTLEIGTHKTISMQLIQVQRDYNISVEIQKADDLNNLVIKDCFACISGIPQSMNFYYQVYDTENTCKMPFRMHINAEDNASNKTVKFDRTLGLMNVCYGPDTLLTTSTNGPGVLQMILPCLWNGYEVNLQVLCNISKSISESGIIRKEESGWRWGGSTELPIKISTKITAEMLDKARKEEIVILKD